LDDPITNPLNLPLIVSPSNEGGSVLKKFLSAATPILIIAREGSVNTIPGAFFISKNKPCTVVVDGWSLPIVELFYQAPWVEHINGQLQLHDGNAELMCSRGMKQKGLIHHWKSTYQQCFALYPPIINLQIGEEKLLARNDTTTVDNMTLIPWVNNAIKIGTTTDEKLKRLQAMIDATEYMLGKECVGMLRGFIPSKEQVEQLASQEKKEFELGELPQQPMIIQASRTTSPKLVSRVINETEDKDKPKLSRPPSPPHS